MRVEQRHQGRSKVCACRHWGEPDMKNLPGPWGNSCARLRDIAFVGRNKRSELLHWHHTSGLGSSPATRSRSGPFGLRTACAATGAPEGLTMPKELAATLGPKRSGGKLQMLFEHSMQKKRS